MLCVVRLYKAVCTVLCQAVREGVFLVLILLWLLVFAVARAIFVFPMLLLLVWVLICMLMLCLCCCCFTVAVAVVFDADESQARLRRAVRQSDMATGIAFAMICLLVLLLLLLLLVVVLMLVLILIMLLMLMFILLLCCCCYTLCCRITSPRFAVALGGAPTLTPPTVLNCACAAPKIRRIERRERLQSFEDMTTLISSHPNGPLESHLRVCNSQD